MVDNENNELKQENEFAEIEKRKINPLLDIDPQVGFSQICETILCEMEAIPESWPFHHPVPAKIIPEYYDVIKNPVDIHTLKQRCQEHMYQNRESFMADVNLLYSNSVQYSGAEHTFTKTAKKMIEKCKELITQWMQKFIELEQDIVNQPLHNEITNPYDQNFAGATGMTFEKQELYSKADEQEAENENADLELGLLSLQDRVRSDKDDDERGSSTG